jgi:DNA-binding response OmpR family regulator
MRILVVEDEPKMAALVRRGLEREGFACDVAIDGNEALSFEAPAHERRHLGLVFDDQDSHLTRVGGRR